MRLIEVAKESFRKDWVYLLRVVEAAQARRPGRVSLKVVK
jgi:hypothetical protein